MNLFVTNREDAYEALSLVHQAIEKAILAKGWVSIQVTSQDTEPAVNQMTIPFPPAEAALELEPLVFRRVT